MTDGDASSIVKGVVPLPRGTGHAGLSGILTTREHVDRAVRASLDGAGHAVDAIEHELSAPPSAGDAWEATVRPGDFRVRCEVRRAWPWPRLQVIYEVVAA